MFSPSVVDGGLVIISRLKIKETEYHIFNTVAVGADVLADKGCAYAKILIGKSYLHLFTSHTQASYEDHPVDLWVHSYVARYRQIKEIKNFIAKKS